MVCVASTRAAKLVAGRELGYRLPVSFALHESVEIEAPASRVWEVIVDLEHYGEWNPFVVSARSTLVVGEQIHMRVRLLSFAAQPQTETILEHVAGQRLCYGLTGVFAALLRSHRCHQVEPSSDARSRYTSHFELSGPLAFFVRLLLRRPLERGFAANTASLAARAAALAAPRESAREAAP